MSTACRGAASTRRALRQRPVGIDVSMRFSQSLPGRVPGHLRIANRSPWGGPFDGLSCRIGAGETVAFHHRTRHGAGSVLWRRLLQELRDDHVGRRPGGLVRRAPMMSGTRGRESPTSRRWRGPDCATRRGAGPRSGEPWPGATSRRWSSCRSPPTRPRSGAASSSRTSTRTTDLAECADRRIALHWRLPPKGSRVRPRLRARRVTGCSTSWAWRSARGRSGI